MGSRFSQGKGTFEELRAWRAQVHIPPDKSIAHRLPAQRPRWTSVLATRSGAVNLRDCGNAAHCQITLDTCYYVRADNDAVDRHWQTGVVSAVLYPRRNLQAAHSTSKKSAYHTAWRHVVQVRRMPAGQTL